MRNFSEGIKLVKNSGYSIKINPQNPKNTDFKQIFKKIKPDILFIDTLGSSNSYISTLRNYCKKIITLDDITSTASEADVIINGILWAKKKLPNTYGIAKVYQGIEYIFLRKEFALANKNKKKIYKHVKELIISTGGTDKFNLSFQISEAISNITTKALNVNIMAGPGYKNISLLETKLNNLNSRINYNVIKNSTDMANYLNQADIAIISGGTVMFEAMACGTPSIIFAFAKNQISQAEWFHKKGALLYLGYCKGKIDKNLVSKKFIELVKNHSLRGEYSKISKNLVDANGAQRILRILKNQILV